MEATTWAIDGTVNCASLEEARALFCGTAGCAAAVTGAAGATADGAGAGEAFLLAVTVVSACLAGADGAVDVLVLFTGVFEAGAAVGLADFAAEFAAGAAAGLFEGLDVVAAAFLGAALTTALTTALAAGLATALLAACGRPAFSAAAAGRCGLSPDAADGFPSARVLSGLPKPRPINWKNVAII